jgi:hypothetical protein
MSDRRKVKSRSPKRITRHTSKTKAHLYRHLYPRGSKKRTIRRIPLPEEVGMGPYYLSQALYEQCGKQHPLFASTKFCKNLYKGCKDPYCTFAHSDVAARWTVDHAMEDVYFQAPPRSVVVRGVPRPDSSHIPRFVVRLDEEDEDEDTPSISLSEMEIIRKKWEQRRKQLAHDQWLSHLQKEWAKKRREKLLLELQSSKDSDSDMDLGD